MKLRSFNETREFQNKNLDYSYISESLVNRESGLKKVRQTKNCNDFNEGNSILTGNIVLQQLPLAVIK